jgi:hypothetical protein
VGQQWSRAFSIGALPGPRGLAVGARVIRPIDPDRCIWCGASLTSGEQGKTPAPVMEDVDGQIQQVGTGYYCDACVAEFRRREAGSMIPWDEAMRQLREGIIQGDS